MENLFYKTDDALKKAVLGRYCCMGGAFFAAVVPEKMSFFAKLRLKRQLRRFDGAIAYSDGDIIPYIKTQAPDGSICVCDNIEALCRKLCKNNSVLLPPSVVICDRIFTDASARILDGLGRLCKSICIVTKSRTAYGYAEYMLDEYGCVVTVTDTMQEGDIIIAADRIENSMGALVVDIFGKNAHITSGRVSELFFEYKNLSCEDRALLGRVCNGRMYDFLCLSGIKATENVNFIGYG